jgi:cytochrome c oxidase assembly factor CtaG
MAGSSRTSGRSLTSRADPTQRRTPLRLSRTTLWLLTAITAIGLAVDAYVHWHLAPGFDTLVGTGSLQISQGQLFRVEAFLAVIAMIGVLATRHRLVSGFAFVVAAGGLAAVLLYGYVDVGALGPLPDMYDPVWTAEKTISAVAEALAAVGALCLFLLARPYRPAQGASSAG